MSSVTKALRRPMMAVVLAVFCALTCSVSEADANVAAPLSNNPELEASVMRVAEELRCLVCQNETIAASQADLAIDLKRQIRLQLAQGRTEDQILEFMVDRYGAFVRYRPAFDPTTLLLWTGPFAMLLLAALVLTRNIRSRRQTAARSELNDFEVERANAILAGREVRS